MRRNENEIESDVLLTHRDVCTHRRWLADQIARQEVCIADTINRMLLPRNLVLSITGYFVEGLVSSFALCRIMVSIRQWARRIVDYIKQPKKH